MQLPSGGSPELETSTTNPETFGVGPNVFLDFSVPAAIIGVVLLIAALVVIGKKVLGI